MQTERRRSWNADLRVRFKELEDRWNQLHPTISVVDRAGNTGAALSDFGLSAETLAVLQAHRPNLLLIGPDSNLERVLHALTPFTAAPTVSCRAGQLSLPHRLIGTLVLRAVEQLTRDEQELMFGWMSGLPIRPQIITTASIPLFPLVIRRQFSDTLFYRLNEMCVIVR